MRLVQPAHQTDRVLVPERHVDNSVVAQGAHHRERSRLLPAAQRARRNEQAGVFAVVAGARPDGAGLEGNSVRKIINSDSLK